MDQVLTYALLLGNATTIAKLGFFLETHREALMIPEDYLEKNRLVLKGGTALNLFFFDLPRLSVDIDLNYVGKLEGGYEVHFYKGKALPHKSVGKE